jgi:histidinol-phosphatase (PHP family)
MRLEEAIDVAKKMGLGLIITDHMDLNYPDPERFYFEVEDYFSAYEKYRSDRLLLGIEMGMRPDCLEENRGFHNNYGFDFILGSVHVVNGVDIYELEYYENRSKKDAYEEYFRAILECVRSYDFIDSLGHIDYIARYARVKEPELYYRDFASLIDEILRVLAQNDKALELNTRRLDDKKALNNLIEIYRRFGELGGKYITIGSDSHKREDIGKNFKEARDLAEICGLNIVHFKERKMILSK